MAEPDDKVGVPTKAASPASLAVAAVAPAVAPEPNAKVAAPSDGLIAEPTSEDRAPAAAASTTAHPIVKPNADEGIPTFSGPPMTASSPSSLPVAEEATVADAEMLTPAAGPKMEPNVEVAAPGAASPSAPPAAAVVPDPDSKASDADSAPPRQLSTQASARLSRAGLA